MHVTLKVSRNLPSLRSKAAHAVLLDAFGKVRDGDRLRLLHYSVQHDHVHLLVEARDSAHLARGMQGLNVRLARGLNRLWHRAGRLFDDRYHARILRTPGEVRNALAYVLLNGRKHGAHPSRTTPDPYSSGAWFDGWREFSARAWDRATAPVARARTWLATVGWRKRGKLSLTGVPFGR